MKRIALLVLLWGTTVLSAQTFKFEDDRTVAIKASEGQSTVVAPGHPQCSGGRILVSSDVAPGQPGNIVYRDLNGTTSTASIIDPLPNQNLYRFLTSDHDLVSMSNGDVYYLTGAGSEVPINPPPAWFESAHRTTLGPGARSTLLVWRSTDCGKTFHYMPDMELDSGTFGDGSCGFPQGQLTHFHDEGVTHYLVPFRAFSSAGDDRFAWCQSCEQLFLNDPSQPTVCPRGGKHNVSGNNYELTTLPIPNFESKATFKVCKQCGTVFNTASRNSACALQTHDFQGSPEYFMPFGDPPPVKTGRPARWRWCSKCQTMIEGSTAIAGCPLGASHDLTVSAHYDVKKFTSTTLASVKKWTKCSKCAGIFERGAKGNVCAITQDKHVDSGIDLQLFTTKPATGDSQGGWKRCNRCGLFFFGPNQSASHCPLVREHRAASGAPTYQLAVESTTVAPPATLQPLWRTCTKCGSVYFSGDGGGSCVVERESDQSIFDMGGSDGQLVFADTNTDRLYLTFRCVGRVPSTNPGKFDLTGKKLDKTLVAFSQGGQPWTLIATPEINAWRTQIVPLDPVSIAIGGGVTDAFFRATKTAGKWSFSNVTPVNGGSANYSGIDWKKAPYSAIKAGIHAHTVIARTPGTTKAFVVVPATIPNQGHGFRIYFEGAPGQFSQALKPITPATKSTADVAFHLQAIPSGPGGPVLLYWYDFDTNANKITIRGRLITGDGKYSKSDFAISRSGNAARSFPPALEKSYGDYQTAGGYVRSDARHVFHPMWVESPDNTVHFGTVIYDPFALVAQDVFVTALKPPVARKAIPLMQWKLSRQARAQQEEHERKRD